MGNNRSGGSGCGWTFGFVAMIAVLLSLYITGGVGVGSLTKGAVGLPAEAHNLSGLLVLVAIVALGLAKGQKR